MQVDNKGLKVYPLIGKVEKILSTRFEKDNLEEEAVKKIESYGACYDSDSDLSAFDQLQICEAVAESTPVKKKPSFEAKENNELPNEECSSVKCLNGTSKRQTNTKLNNSKLSLILKDLEDCNYKTPPKKIAAILEKFFPNSKPGHWLWVGQNYTPKTLRSRLRYIENRQREGWETIITPGAYLTELLKHKKKRKR